MKIPRSKISLLLGIVLLYLLIGGAGLYLVAQGLLPRMDPTPLAPIGSDDVPDISTMTLQTRLAAATGFVDSRLIRDGHIDLYVPAANSTYAPDRDTNSEAVSYYLEWNARMGNKERFDAELDYMERYMIDPRSGHLRWRLNTSDRSEGDGANIASDADLRAIGALLIAEERWGDMRYTRLIDRLAGGVERLAVTDDGYLAPYGGLSGTDPWTAKEVWLSYEDFTVIRAMSERRGEPWTTMYAKMKNATLGAQLENGLYNSMLTESRQYGNGLDANGYGINSLWIMVRSAESGDPQLRASARKSLEFYESKYQIDAELYALYGSDGDPLSPTATPWVYALVGRAASALGEDRFAQAMVDELLKGQIEDPRAMDYGAIPEGGEGDKRVGQFTMQESILAMISTLGDK